MAFCGSCGNTMADGTTYCPHCGVPVGVPQPNPPQPQPVSYVPPAVSGTSGLQENIAGLLCYVLGWLTGLVFFFIDKRPFVRFHAAQSIVVFGGLHILHILLRVIFGFGMFGGVGFWAGVSLLVLILSIINLITLVLWIVLMVTAYQGKRFEVPVAAAFAKQLAGSTV
jgi:uncharacterized membrane protein